MKLNFLVLVLLLSTVAACQQPGFRKPSSDAGPIILKNHVENILSDISNPDKFKLETCGPYINEIYKDVLALTPSRFDYTATKENWKSIYNSLWLVRVKLRERLTEFSAQVPVTDANLSACVSNMRDGFRLSRWMEDYLAESFSGEPQEFKAGEPKFVLDEKYRKTTLRGESPWLVVNPKHSKIMIRSGDLITSRGNAYTSSAIARIAEIDSQFSHLAVVYAKDEPAGKEYTVEEI